MIPVSLPQSVTQQFDGPLYGLRIVSTGPGASYAIDGAAAQPVVGSMSLRRSRPYGRITLTGQLVAQIADAADEDLSGAASNPATISLTDAGGLNVAAIRQAADGTEGLEVVPVPAVPYFFDSGAVVGQLVASPIIDLRARTRLTARCYNAAATAAVRAVYIEEFADAAGAQSLLLGSAPPYTVFSLNQGVEAWAFAGAGIAPAASGNVVPPAVSQYYWGRKLPPFMRWSIQSQPGGSARLVVEAS